MQHQPEACASDVGDDITFRYVLVVCVLAVNWYRYVVPLQINLIAPPLYVITTNTLERVDGLTKLNEVLEKIKKVIEDNGGVFTIKMQVRLMKLQLVIVQNLYCIMLYCAILLNLYNTIGHMEHKSEHCDSGVSRCKELFSSK